MSKNNTPTSLPTTISDLQDIENIFIRCGAEFDDKGHTVTIHDPQWLYRALLAAFEKHLLSLIPKHRVVSDEDDLVSTYELQENNINKGYNQAITDITQLIKENKEKI